MSEDQRKSFEEVSRPVIEWLRKNCHPHHVLIIDCTSAELSEGKMSVVAREYLAD